MTRVGYVYTEPSPGPGQSASLQAFLTANLTTWTVVAAWTVAINRFYFVLRHTSEPCEILIYAGDQSYNNGIAPVKRCSYIGDTVAPFSLISSPISNLSTLNGLDPALDATWLASLLSSDAKILDYWYSGGPAQIAYFIEDDTIPLFAVYSGNSPGDTYLGHWLFGQFFDNTYDSALDWRDYVELYVNPGTGAPITPQHFVAELFGNTGYRAIISNDQASLWSNLRQAFTGLPRAGDNKYPTTRLPITNGTDQSNATVHGYVSMDVARYAPRLPATYRTIHGDDQINYPFVHLYRDHWTPWANGLTLP